MSKREAWNQRYAAKDLVWGAEPNRFVEEALAGVEPRGRALDLACGEGRNAIWLAERGWRTTGVDFSRVGVERARQLAAERGVEVEFVEADVTRWKPEAGAFALVLVLYLQIPPPERRRVWAHVASALAAGGELFAVGHARRNLVEGYGGPQDAALLWEPGEVAAELEAVGLEVGSIGHVTRTVEEAQAEAIDTRVRARRP